MKILLIDERPGTLEFLGENIVNFGYKTGVASDKSDIVPMLLDDKYDIVLANNGNGDGDFDELIRSQCPSVFIIHMTLSEEQRKGKNGVDLYLERPFESSRLRSAISTFLCH